MESRAKFLGHPIHPMLIPLPLGLLSGSVAFDVAHRVTGDDVWGTVAAATIGAGIVGGIIAAPFGVIDWVAIPDGTRAKRIGSLHGLGNVGVLGLFGASWWLRHERPQAMETLPFGLSLAGLALAAGTGWLGGELVDRLGVGVDPGANLDAPSSLSDEPVNPAHGIVEQASGRPASIGRT
jgi:uncharacterized membrane protein